MKLHASRVVPVLSPVLLVAYLVCGGLSLFCPMLGSAATEMPAHASHMDHTTEAGGGCPDSLSSSAAKADHQPLCVLEATDAFLLAPEPPVPSLHTLAGPPPQLWGPPRYTLLSTFRI